jgi:hypothetical protein
MRIAYLDCPSGISGDMTLAALVDAGVDLAAIQQGVDSLGLPSCRLVASEVRRKGFRATHVRVEHEPEHAHRHLHHITGMIDASGLSADQKQLARRIFTRLAEAEAKVHGTSVEKVHFHEVGAVDSIADIVGAAIGWDLLGVDRIIASPIPTGSGFVEIAHGRCSIPAPATAELLQGIPLAASEVQGELTTPTGAAIVATLVDEFGPVPSMTIDRIGIGAGTSDFALQANLLRLLVGTAVGEEHAGSATSPASLEHVWLLETNLDDATGECVGHCIDRLWEAGALDVFTTPIYMKKNRPGVQLSVLCAGGLVATMEAILYRQTPTLGVRRRSALRSVLERKPHTVQTGWGPVEGVLAMVPGSASRFSPEFESCRRIADEHEVSYLEVDRAARAAFDPPDADAS